MDEENQQRECPKCGGEVVEKLYGDESLTECKDCGLNLEGWDWGEQP